MLQSNGIMFGWNRPVAGREAMAGELFKSTTSWLEKWKVQGNIESWEPVFLQTHGGDLNGFFWIRCTPTQLTTLKSNDEWVDIVMRAGQYLTGVGVIECYAGSSTVQDLMSRWTRTIPAR